MPGLLGVGQQSGRAPGCLHFASAFQTGSQTQHRSHSSARPSHHFCHQHSFLGGQQLQWQSGCRQQRNSRSSAVPTSAIFGFLKGNLAEKTRKRYQPQVDQINALAGEVKQLSDEQLRERTRQLQQRCKDGASLDSLLVETFAVLPSHPCACFGSCRPQ